MLSRLSDGRACSSPRKILDVGCGAAKRPGAVGVDRADLPGVDVVHDLNVFPWPFEDEQFDEIYMYDIIEHLDDTIRVMEEVHRLLRPAGRVHIQVVYWNSRHSYSDPTHVRFFTEETFRFFTGEKRAYYTKARFAVESLVFMYDSLARKLFPFRKLLNLMAYFLCNVRQGMRVTMHKLPAAAR